MTLKTDPIVLEQSKAGAMDEGSVRNDQPSDSTPIGSTMSASSRPDNSVMPIAVANLMQRRLQCYGIYPEVQMFSYYHSMQPAIGSVGE